MVLTLEWEPHSGFNVFSLTSDGRAPASEIRTMFQRYRQGAAEIILLSSPRLPFPEMECFGPTKCQCLDYEEKGNQRSSTVGTSKPAQEPFKLLGGLSYYESPMHHSHIMWRFYGLHKTSEGVGVRGHLFTANKSPCIITLYSRHITVCSRMDQNVTSTAATPFDDWYHAADPDFTPPQTSPNRPCRDKNCINYYRSAASFACPIL